MDQKIKDELKEINLFRLKNWKLTDKYDILTKILVYQVLYIPIDKSLENKIVYLYEQKVLEFEYLLFMFNKRIYFIKNDDCNFEYNIKDDHDDKNFPKGYYNVVTKIVNDKIGALFYLDKPLKEYQYKGYFYTWFVRVALKIQIKLKLLLNDKK